MRPFALLAFLLLTRLTALGGDSLEMRATPSNSTPAVQRQGSTLYDPAA